VHDLLDSISVKTLSISTAEGMIEAVLHSVTDPG
jgi:hypothetical protein